MLMPMSRIVRFVFTLVAAGAMLAHVGLQAMAQDAAPVVQVTGGAIRGAVADGVAAFRGVPFAAPPVGALRWRPPAPPTAWTGVRDASAFGNSCPQSNANGVFANPSTTEDCLYLNVFAPAGPAPGAKRAVIVWFPGGGFVGGSGADYDAGGLVKDGVIVVTMNWRVGALGFFAYPALDTEKHALADYGLMDQQYALQWVQENIAAFGGDPANVTIAGESSGATMVLSHLVSPGSRGLFVRAIIESGGAPPATARPVPPLDAAEDIGRRVATAAGCSDLACLRALPPMKLVEAQAPIHFGVISGANTPLPQNFHAAFTSGASAHVPILAGSNHDEWRWSVANGELASGKPLTADRYTKAITAFFGAKMAPAIIAAYPLASYPSPSVATGTVETDGYMACGTLKLAQWVAPAAPYYEYQFDDRTVPMYMPAVSFPYGAAHTSELQFIFPNFHGGSGTIQPLSPAELQLASTMRRYWTNFAKTGNPNGGGLVRWPTFTAAGAQVLSFAPGKIAPISDFAAQHQCGFWDSLSDY
jgi:para-nitrobenzyl esterase